jgi:hypothetical protein
MTPERLRLSSLGAPAAAGYQAWAVPQWGQVTVVETGATNAKPHAHT